MQPFHIEGQTDQIPFACYLHQSAQGELAKSLRLLDDSDHGLDCALAQPVDLLSDLGPEFVSHLFFGARCFRGWRRLLLEKLPPVLVRRLAPGGDVRIYTSTLPGHDLALTVEPVVERRSLGVTYPWINRIDCRDCLLAIIGVVRDEVG